jgi:hypothetical protein
MATISHTRLRGILAGSALWGLLIWVPLAHAACTPSALKTLLLADADSIGLFIPATARQDNTVLAIANLIRPESKYARSKGVVTRDQFLGSWADVIEGIQAIPDPAVKAQWEYRRDKLLLPKDTIDYDSALISAFFGRMITDGLVGAAGPVTQADIDARTQRQGSWAELRCGTQLTLAEVSAALNLP